MEKHANSTVSSRSRRNDEIFGLLTTTFSCKFFSFLQHFCSSSFVSWYKTTVFHGNSRLVQMFRYKTPCVSRYLTVSTHRLSSATHINKIHKQFQHASAGPAVRRRRTRALANSCAGLRSMRAQEFQCVVGACMREYMRVRLGARRMEQASS